MIVWRTPAQWWNGLRVQKTTLIVLSTISWAMKPSGIWSMLSHSGEKPTHMEMVKQLSQMWLKNFVSNCFHRSFYPVPNRKCQQDNLCISQWILPMVLSFQNQMEICNGNQAYYLLSHCHRWIKPRKWPEQVGLLF